MTQDTLDLNKSVSDLSISELLHEVALLTYRVEYIRWSGQTNSSETIHKYLGRVREIEAEAHRWSGDSANPLCAKCEKPMVISHVCVNTDCDRCGQ